jgi:hypothetical protein
MTINSGVYITDQPFTLGLPVRPPSISGDHGAISTWWETKGRGRGFEPRPCNKFLGLDEVISLHFRCRGGAASRVRGSR